MREALQNLNANGETTRCQDKPVPYTEIRQTPAEAAALCEGCPLIRVCGQLGYTESVYADDMVYGGLTWRKGLPLLSEVGFEQKRGLGELRKVKVK